MNGNTGSVNDDHIQFACYAAMDYVIGECIQSTSTLVYSNRFK